MLGASAVLLHVSHHAGVPAAVAAMFALAWRRVLSSAGRWPTMVLWYPAFLFQCYRQDSILGAHCSIYTCSSTTELHRYGVNWAQV